MAMIARLAVYDCAPLQLGSGYVVCFGDLPDNAYKPGLHHHNPKKECENRRDHHHQELFR
jgi:hypothetical protein